MNHTYSNDSLHTDRGFVRVKKPEHLQCVFGTPMKKDDIIQNIDISIKKSSCLKPQKQRLNEFRVSTDTEKF